MLAVLQLLEDTGNREGSTDSSCKDAKGSLKSFQVSQVPLALWALLTWLPTSGRDIALMLKKIRSVFLLPCCPKLGA